MFVINLYVALKNYLYRCFFSYKLSSSDKVSIFADAIDNQKIAYEDLQSLERAVRLDMRCTKLRVVATRISTYMFIAALAMIECILIKAREHGLPIDSSMVVTTLAFLLCPVVNSIISIRSEKNLMLMKQYLELINTGIKRYERYQKFSRHEEQ